MILNRGALSLIAVFMCKRVFDTDGAAADLNVSFTYGALFSILVALLTPCVSRLLIVPNIFVRSDVFLQIVGTS